MKKLNVLCSILCVFLLFSSMKVSAQESNQINSKNCSQVTITNDLTEEVLTQDMNLTNHTIQICDNNIEVTESYETILEIGSDGSTVELLNPETFVLPQESSNYSTLSNSTGSASNANTYWKAYITVTYSKTSSSVNFSKVDGYWTQLRGTTTLSNRYVYYGATIGKIMSNGSGKPTENTFSYDTGFGSLTYNADYEFGAYSQADITTYGGQVMTLEAKIDVSRY